MAGHVISSLSALARPNVQSGPIDLLFRETDLLNLLRANGCVKDGSGPSPFKWNVVTASNSSVEVFVEGQAMPLQGRQTYVQASVDAFYVRGVAGTTGHVLDNISKGGFYDDPTSIERLLVESDLFKKIEDELVGSTQDRGIAAVIDSTGTYAGLAQGTYSVWASEENGTIGTLGVDDLQDLYEELTSASVGGVARGSSPTHVLMPVNQLTNYVNTIGAGASSGGVFRMNMGQGGFDVGQSRIGGGQAFNGMPIAVVRGMTTTETYMLDITDIELLVHRDLTVAPIVGNPEEVKFAVSCAMALKVKRRNKHGKLTGITA